MFLRIPEAAGKRSYHTLASWTTAQPWRPVKNGSLTTHRFKLQDGSPFPEVPSLKGLWYRRHYLHDRSVARLEELDPDRLSETHVPGGFTPSDKRQHAIKGHEFGLKLPTEERQQLVAFLRTL